MIATVNTRALLTAAKVAAHGVTGRSTRPVQDKRRAMEERLALLQEEGEQQRRANV